MSHSVRPQRRQPTRPLCLWDSPGKNTGVGCHFLLQCMKVKSESEIAQSCLTLHDPTDCSLPGSSVHGIFQARVLEWGAIAFSSDWLHRGLLHSFWQWEILVWNLVFISPGGLFCLRYDIFMATRHSPNFTEKASRRIVQSSLWM